MNKILGVIFDLDGVIVSTDHCHYLAWKRLADEEGIHFNRRINERLRGVSRLDSLAILLEKSTVKYSQAEKEVMAFRKNTYYVESINGLSRKDILPGAMQVLESLQKAHIKTAIGSSSKNALLIMRKIGLENSFDAIVDGNQIVNSKPDPEVFLLAAGQLGLPPDACLVVEDADAGVEAAIAGGMRCLGVGYAARNPAAAYRVESLETADFMSILYKVEAGVS